MTGETSHAATRKAPEEIAQHIINDNAASEAILDEHRAALEVVNRCAILEAERPGEPKTLVARSKVEQTLWDICIGAAHTMNTPFLAEVVVEYIAAGQAASKSRPRPAEYEHPSGLAEHPEPLGRFLRDHIGLTMTAAERLTNPRINPDPYALFVAAARTVKQRNTAAHNARQASEQETSRGSASSRTQAVRLTEGDTIVFARGSLADTGYFFMQPMVSADLACHEQGITEPREVAAIILGNLSLLDTLTRMRTEDFPYVAPTYDRNTYKVPNAGTFERMCEKLQGPGRMRLEDDGRLVLPELGDILTGGCPARYATLPAAWSHDSLEAFHEDVAATHDLPPAIFDLRHSTLAKRGFTIGALIAEQTFLGTSHALVTEG
jgi:hypothetical protein